MEKAQVIGALLGLLTKPLAWILERVDTARAATLSHDRGLFKKLDEAVNETFLADLLNSHLYNNWCEKEDAVRLGHFLQDFRREENQFVDKRVRDAARETFDKLQLVRAFIGQHYFSGHLGPDDTRLRLYPELRDSPDEARRKRFWDHSKELNGLTDEAWDSYKKFRAIVKQRLKM